MKLNIFVSRSKKEGERIKLNREERVNFAKFQFLELKRKNLGVPVKLYQL